MATDSPPETRLHELRPLPPRPRRHDPRRSLARVRRPLLTVVALATITGAAGLAALHLRSAATSVLPVALPEPTAPAPSRPPLAYTDGVFSDDTGRWTVGAPGDEVAVGDWDCDGTPTLTLLRISTGTVYAFLTWATADADATADALGVIDSANRLESADFDGDGCDDLLVHRRAGAPITMHPPDHL